MQQRDGVLGLLQRLFNLTLDLSLVPGLQGYHRLEFVLTVVAVHLGYFYFLLFGVD